MNFKDITDKLKDTVVLNNKREEPEINETDEKEIAEDNNMDYEQESANDEIEFVQEQPIKIKTVFVKSEDEEVDYNKKRKITGAVKIAAGATLIAAAGITAFLLGSKKKRW